MDCSMPGSSVQGILQARRLEWVAMPFSRGSSWPRDWTQVSCIADRFFTIWATREAQDRTEKGIFRSLSRQVFVCLFLTCVRCVLSYFSHVRLFSTPRSVAAQAPCTRGFPGKNTGVGWHFLLHVFDLEISIYVLINFYWSVVDLQCCVSVSVQQSESVIHIHISTLVSILFPYRSLQSIE